MRPESSFRMAANWPQIEKNNDVTICRYDVCRHFFWSCRVFLVRFSYWSKFHVNIMTGYGVMTIFVYKGLTRSPEIGNIHVWVLSNIWRLLRIPKLVRMSLIKSYWMLQNAKVTAFSDSELLRMKWRFSTILKASKKVYEVMFFNV